jgi:deoxyribodipyrimidine photo-lyase
MTVPTDGVAVVWFRRDLRIHDHPALAATVRAGSPIAPLFVLDPAILHGRFASSNRTWFMLGAIRSLAEALETRGSRLTVHVGRPEDVVPAFAARVGATEVLVSRDYTPFGRARDRVVADRLAALDIAFRARAGVLIQEPEQVLTADGRPYTQFAPFHRRWDARSFRPMEPAPSAIPTAPAVLAAVSDPIPTAADLGVPPPTADPAFLPMPGEPAARARLDAWLDQGPMAGVAAYAATRDHLFDPEGTSRLGPDLRLGLLSPVEVALRARATDPGAVGPERFVSELAWRDFYAHGLWHEPRLAREPHASRLADLDWPGGDAGLDAWRTGRTGYPIVDAPMRQLVATGSMPNRARMIVASFLTKDLLVDWREGESFFMTHLVDGDPASNLGGWQWAASVGADAQPWFRVFNPVTQGERFDPDGVYVRRWLPELARVPTARIHAPWTMSTAEETTAGCRIGPDYPAPIVDHAEARARALAWFRAATQRDTH